MEISCRTSSYFSSMDKRSSYVLEPKMITDCMKPSLVNHPRQLFELARERERSVEQCGIGVLTRFLQSSNLTLNRGKFPFGVQLLNFPGAAHGGPRGVRLGGNARHELQLYCV